MARFRETVCVHYECVGPCKKGRQAEYSGYCQRCDLYSPRVHEKHINMKKKELERVRKKEAQHYD